MATNPAEYRKSFRKTFEVDLPSGAKFEVRPFGIIDLAEAPVSLTDKTWIKFILPRCIIAPKIVDKLPVECAEDELSIEDIAPEDQAMLVKTIGDKSKSITESFFGQAT